jgi:PqqD family protein of HPr-rel-A system
MQRVRSLAINPDGFAFDPTTGESYTLNATGLALLQALRDGRTADELGDVLVEQFGAQPEEAARDADDFLDHLRTFRLL